jgi:hypothetical protein
VSLYDEHGVFHKVVAWGEEVQFLFDDEEPPVDIMFLINLEMPDCSEDACMWFP